MGPIQHGCCYLKWCGFFWKKGGWWVGGEGFKFRGFPQTTLINHGKQLSFSLCPGMCSQTPKNVSVPSLLQKHPYFQVMCTRDANETKLKHFTWQYYIDGSPLKLHHTRVSQWAVYLGVWWEGKQWYNDTLSHACYVSAKTGSISSPLWG